LPRELPNDKGEVKVNFIGGEGRVRGKMIHGIDRIKTLR
jgi:hypothetical protein